MAAKFEWQPSPLTDEFPQCPKTWWSEKLSHNKMVLETTNVQVVVPYVHKYIIAILVWFIPTNGR